MQKLTSNNNNVNDSIQYEYNASKKEQELSLREKFLNMAGKGSSNYDARVETLLKLAVMFSKFDGLRYGDYLSKQELYTLASIAIETKNTNTPSDDIQRITWWRQRINTIACSYDGKYGSQQELSVYRMTKVLGLKKGEFPSSFTAVNDREIARSTSLVDTAKQVQVPFFDIITLTDDDFNVNFSLSPNKKTVQKLSTFAIDLSFNSLHIACIILRLLEKPELCTLKEIELLSPSISKWDYEAIYKELSKTIYAQNFGVLVGRAGEAQVKQKIKQELGLRFKESTWNEDVLHDIDFKVMSYEKMGRIPKGAKGTKFISFKTGKTGLLEGLKKYRRNAKRTAPNYYIGLSNGFSLDMAGNVQINDDTIKIFAAYEDSVQEIGTGINCIIRELRKK